MAHITDEQIKKYYAHMLRKSEEIYMLGHIARCEYCATRFASGLPQTEMLTLPHGVSVGILEKAEKIPTKQLRRREYYGYCTRVALGMCMSLALLVTVNLTYNAYPQNMQGTVLEQFSQYTDEKSENTMYGKEDLTAKKTEYEKKQSEMKKEQDSERKKFIEKRKESSGSKSFSINRVFRNLQKYLNIKNK